MLKALMTRSFWTQCAPPKPTFTDKDVPPGSQVGRVFIVTGGNSGVGLELIKLLYPTGATIYMASRSRSRAEEAIRGIIEAAKADAPDSPDTDPAKLKFLHLDLADIASVKAAAAAFTAQETRLDILWNNAGIAGSPPGTLTKQGIEGHMGVNCVAPLLFTQEVLGLLRATAAAERAAGRPGGVRVVWASSITMEAIAPPGGVDLDFVESLNVSSGGGGTVVPPREYATSKCGNWFLAAELARREGEGGLVSVAENPGQLDTAAWRNESAASISFIRKTLYEPKMGAYTMLYAGFAPEVAEHNGAYIMPWGRILDLKTWPRPDLVEAVNKGAPEKFWEWCEKKAETKD